LEKEKMKTRGGKDVRLRTAFPAILWMWFAMIPSSGAEQAKRTEYQVQAAYLYNFGRFIRWPANIIGAQQDAFTVCIFGQDPFGNTLNATVAGGTIWGKSVTVKRLSNPEDAASCRILFISSSEADRLHYVLEALEKASVLTVSDMPQFSQRGGMIQFVMERNRVRFEVNFTATQNAGLILSSELLKVATVVRKNAVSGG
jgi:hypothetical protein